MGSEIVPGELDPGDGTVRINEDRKTTTVVVGNTGDRPIQVGSHYHFFETNRALRFDREASFGMRLDIPAGTAVRFEPGDERTVDLVAYGGDRRLVGMNGLTDGRVSDVDPAEALDRARERGFEIADDDSANEGSADEDSADEDSADDDPRKDDREADSE